jgi:hypothetical protein
MQRVALVPRKVELLPARSSQLKARTAKKPAVPLLLLQLPRNRWRLGGVPVCEAMVELELHHMSTLLLFDLFELGGCDSGVNSLYAFFLLLVFHSWFNLTIFDCKFARRFGTEDTSDGFSHCDIQDTCFLVCTFFPSYLLAEGSSKTIVVGFLQREP